MLHHQQLVMLWVVVLANGPQSAPRLEAMFSELHWGLCWCIQRVTFAFFFYSNIPNWANLNLIGVCHEEAHWARVSEQLFTTHTAGWPAAAWGRGRGWWRGTAASLQTSCCLSLPIVSTSHRRLNAEGRDCVFYLYFSESQIYWLVNKEILNQFTQKRFSGSALSIVKILPLFFCVFNGRKLSGTDFRRFVSWYKQFYKTSSLTSIFYWSYI